MNGHCPDCGESYSGDGYLVPLHCPNVADIDGIEPDTRPVNCAGYSDYGYEHGAPLGPIRAAQAHEDR